jgi:hypothetical protein
MMGLAGNTMLGQSPTGLGNKSTPLGDPSVIKIKDTRKRDAVSNLPITDKNRKDATVNRDVVKGIIKEAKTQGVDPYTALAVAHQETNFKDYGDNDYFHVLDPDFSDPSDDYVHLGVKALKNKMDYGTKLGKKDEASVLQAFNGYGKIGKNTEGHQSKMYGVDVSKGDIDMAKTPLWGKRVIDLRDNILKNNPEIARLVQIVDKDGEIPAPYKDAYVSGLNTNKLLGIKPVQ